MENDYKYKKGDIVVHKTNPNVRLLILNVESRHNGVDCYTCSWITTKGKYRTKIFYDYELKTKKARV